VSQEPDTSRTLDARIALLPTLITKLGLKERSSMSVTILVN